MQLHDLTPAAGSTHSRKRVGRGNSGKGGTYAGRGLNGQGSRSGGTKGAGFEGGQTPLAMRLPKLPGFKNPRRIEYTAVNVSTLEVKFEDGAVVMVHPSRPLVSPSPSSSPSRCSATARFPRSSRSRSTRSPLPRRLRSRPLEERSSFRANWFEEHLPHQGTPREDSFTIAMLVVYRIGAHVPVPGIPFQGMSALLHPPVTPSPAVRWPC